MQELFLLGVKFNNVSLLEAKQKVREFLDSSDKQYRIFTPNPEMVVRAQKDEYFRYSLNQGDLNLCDGIGIQFISKEKIERITGADFMLDICKIAEEKGRGVYLLGSGNDEVVTKTAESLQKKFPKLIISGWSRGEIINEDHVTSGDVEIINKKHPDIVFVAFGMGKQEKWVIENLSKMPSVKIAMVVGGAFDYISGKVKRAPLLMRRIGLEWLYRLMKQPKRVVRILNATFKFLYLSLKN